MAVPLTFVGQGPLLLPSATGVEAVSFDGTTGYFSQLATPALGGTRQRFGLSSLWFKFRASTGADQYLFSTAINNPSRVWSIWREQTTGLIRTISRDSVGSDVTQIDSSITISIDNIWHHLALNVFTSTSTGQLYLDGVDRSVVNFMSAATDIAHDTATDARIAANTTGGGGATANFAAVDLAFVWFDIDNLDLSTNITKFRTAGGAPANLGSNGQTPTGSTPNLYMHGLLSAWSTNLGTGGNLSPIGGITQAANDPP